jgi:hypothetical protein
VFSRNASNGATPPVIEALPFNGYCR